MMLISLLLLILFQDITEAIDDVNVYCSSLDGLRLAKQPSVSWKKRRSTVENGPIALVNNEKRFQRDPKLCAIKRAFMGIHLGTIGLSREEREEREKREPGIEWFC